MNDRHRIRAEWHKYEDGVYFVTIVTKGHVCNLGKIEEKKMMLTEIGKIVDKIILEAPSRYPWMELWNYVIMPNHIHMVVNISRRQNDGISKDSPLGCLRSSNHGSSCEFFHHNSPLAVAVNHIKGAVTKFARKSGYVFEWQPRYHEHIIRNSCDYVNIMEYIDRNVDNWISDCFCKK